MCGMVILACWLALAVVFCLFGKLCDSPALLATGAIMVLMVALVSDISY